MTAHFIVPPFLLANLERTAATAEQQERIRNWLETDAAFRARAATPTPRPEGAPATGEGPDRVVHDAENGTELPGRQVRAEGEDPTGDEPVDQAYDGTGATWTMFSECFQRDSIDGAGMRLSSTVHYGNDYANAFWDGAQMVFGDGDGEIFTGFTAAVDITGHELAHGVTEHTAGLEYSGQSGALNESLSDVFGSLAKQHALGQSAADADWIIGAGIFAEGVQGVGLRSMKEPGSAYDDPRLGKDPQPGHMDDYVETDDDNGGVHINSGIPNKAFYLAATEIGGNAYDDAGKIWYATLTGDALTPTSDFATFAAATIAVATDLYGADSAQTTAVTTAWEQVGVTPAEPGQPTAAADQPAEPRPDDEPTAEPTEAEPAKDEPTKGEPTKDEPTKDEPKSDLAKAAATELNPTGVLPPPQPPDPRPKQ